MMVSSNHQTVLNIELEKWSKKSYAEVSKLYSNTSIKSEIIHEGLTYWIKVIGLENTDEYIMFSIECVCEGDTGFFPKSRMILFYADGRVDY